MKCKFLKAMCAALALCLLSTAALAAAFTPGTYTGAGEGYKGDELKVEVTLGEDRIESIKVLENQETPTIGGAAMEALTAQIVEKQSLEVEAVSGATLSSNGLLVAVAAALTEAGADPASLGFVDPQAPVILPPCMLLKEIEKPAEGEAVEGYRYFDYTTQGTTCSDQITFAIKEDDLTVHDLRVFNGCDGTSKGFGALCEDQTIDYCVERMAGILCHGSNGSSCPDQSAKALAQAKVYLTGADCANCGAAQ